MNRLGASGRESTSGSHAAYLFLCKCALGPLLLLQAREVRRAVPRLPEAAGARSGVVEWRGTEPALSILVVGDSSAAGVGVELQEHALAAQIAAEVAAKIERAVRWRPVAKTGITVHGAMELCGRGTAEPADVLVLCLRMNDVLGQTGARKFVGSYRRLVEGLTLEHGVRLVLANGLPPMHIISALPEPLRWYLSQYSRRLDADLRRWALSLASVRYLSLQWAGAVEDLALDGFHPGVRQYKRWADVLAEEIGEWWKAQGNAQVGRRAVDSAVDSASGI